VRTVYVIGIGAGDPDQLTVQAVAAMNRVQVFFTVDKGPDKADLAALRADLLARHVTGGHRVVQVADPPRDRAADDYPAAVADWQDRREALYAALIRDELGPDGVGGFLVWGDPALYDSTLGILEEVHARGAVAFDWTVVPGISSVSSLAARHRVGLNQVGGAVQITTGRRLAESGLPEGVDDVVVMLDAHQSFGRFTDEPLDIYWGAYLGTPDEILVAGPLAETADRIKALRAAARQRKGWIMDTCLLRRRAAD
jgi:precorrin-6A synthase